MAAGELPNYLFKVIVIGESNVGKTTLLRNYTQEDEVGRGIGTLGADHKCVFKELKDGNQCAVNYWDTAGWLPIAPIIYSALFPSPHMVYFLHSLLYWHE